MKKIILKYNLELFSFIVLIVLMIRFLFFPELSGEHRILSAFMTVAILHEYEEKRIPGGFFELMSNKFDLPEEKRHFEEFLCGDYSSAHRITGLERFDIVSVAAAFLGLAK